MNRQSVNGAAGEYAVLVELLRRGFEAYLAHGRTQDGWDIKVYLPGPREVKLQLKAIERRAVQVYPHKDFDLLVIVDLNKPTNPIGSPAMTFRVLYNGDVHGLASVKKATRLDGAQTITISDRPRSANAWKKRCLMTRFLDGTESVNQLL